MFQFRTLVPVALACSVLCGCNQTPAPHIPTAPVPLASRIIRNASDDVTLGDVAWEQWKNPRLIVTPRGVIVLVSGASRGPTVPTQRVPDVLEKTTLSDWPLGLVVMAKYRLDNDGRFDKTDHDALQRNSAELLKTLSHRGIRLVWGPPPA